MKGLNRMGYKIFEKKNCFISGATGGIGRHIAMKLAENNCNLFLTSTNLVKLKKLKDELKLLYSNDIKIFHRHGDLNKIQDISKIVSTARDKMRSIDMLINCAGKFIMKPLSKCRPEDFKTIFNLNIRAPFIFAKEFSQNMKKAKWGRIINIASSSAYAGYKDTSLYCASKHALLGLSRALHAELKQYNIRTFCVSPGATKTEMGRLIKNQKFGTFIDPKDIAEYVLFIASFDTEMVSDEVRLNRMVLE